MDDLFLYTMGPKSFWNCVVMNIAVVGLQEKTFDLRFVQVLKIIQKIFFEIGVVHNYNNSKILL